MMIILGVLPIRKTNDTGLFTFRTTESKAQNRSKVKHPTFYV